MICFDSALVEYVIHLAIIFFTKIKISNNSTLEFLSFLYYLIEKIETKVMVTSLLIINVANSSKLSIRVKGACIRSMYLDI